MEELRLLIEDTDYDGFFLIQRNYTNDKNRANWIKIKDNEKNKETKDYEGFIRNPILRLFRNRKGIKYSGKIHEVVDDSAKEMKLKISTLEIPIHHYLEEKNNNSLEKRQLKYLDIAEKELKKNPDGRLYASAGAVCLQFKKDYKKALEYLQKASELGYKKNISLEGVAECHIHLKEYEKAYEIYKNLVKSGYMSASLCNNLANLLIMYKQYKPALKYLKLALAYGNPNKEKIMKNIETTEKIISNKN